MKHPIAGNHVYCAFFANRPAASCLFRSLFAKNAQHLDTPTRYAFVYYPWNYRGKFVEDHGTHGTFMEDEYPTYTPMHATAQLA